ncbi:hypothetical protein [Arthrobacter cavernae]|uniref:Uncharacterized protein n=1 Tax=Arthrobacter cavernae TaxID=2817681 RepID=A0A939KIX6_9MICC|nr:hypothetical protein [Arthrobacter cavernae]MBO1267104.1 hypothetical protein [Arthrobacter cavernae]
MGNDMDRLGGGSSYDLGVQLYRMLYGRDSIAFSRKGQRTSNREATTQRREIRHPDGRIEYIEQTIINEVIFEEWEN